MADKKRMAACLISQMIDQVKPFSTPDEQLIILGYALSASVHETKGPNKTDKEVNQRIYSLLDKGLEFLRMGDDDGLQTEIQNTDEKQTLSES
jgi:hypothetical protein